MPAVTTESLVQSKRDLPTFLMLDGRWLELRRGCLYDTEDGRRVTDSTRTAAHLLQYGQLTNRDRQHWEEFGEAICAAAACDCTTVTKNQHQRKYVFESLGGRKS